MDGPMEAAGGTTNRWRMSQLIRITLPAAVTQILPASEKRRRVVFFPPSQSGYGLDIVNTVTLTTGIFIGGANGYVDFDYDRDGPIVCNPWFAAAMAAGIQIVFLEVVAG